jgi:rRNA-processing protein FCF1
METIQLLLVVTLLVILAEVTYLVVKLPRQSLGRKQGRSIFVDTSVLIDGRIIAVAKSGFIGDTLVIPRSVIGELQYLADNADHDKRARARYGLDVVQELQTMPHVEVEILQDGSKASEGVDERLLSLAKKYAGVVCTIDYNLNKVAVVEGITVLNVNELAQSLRMAYLPGERMMLELVQKGQDAHQGVGYLPDGTMVVVEHANKLVGQTVEIEFIRSLQTAAGKMMFARRVDTPTKPVQKPAGKKPLQQTAKESVSMASKQPQVMSEASSSKDGRKQQPQASKPKTFHSDPGDQRKANKPASASTKPAQQHRQHPRSKKRTSASREDSLINLLNKQD